MTLAWMALPAGAQDVMMQGWYWDYPKPGCNDHPGPSLASDMAARADAQAAAGFTLLWLPPLSKASFGDCSNGYDPQDLFDYGQVTGQTGLGSGDEVEDWIAALGGAGILPVADVVYNHRDGGAWQDNPVVRDYVVHYPFGGGCGGFPATPYPVNGKFRYVLSLGGGSGNGAGDYYFKFASASAASGFDGREYKLHFRTRDTVFDPVPIFETPVNGGGDCGQPSDSVALGRDIFASQETETGCNTDEFHLALLASDFDATGDLLEVYIEQVNGGGQGIDQRLYGLWSAPRSQDIVAEVRGQTRTDFGDLPSGEGGMDFRHFKPNGLTPTCLTGEEDFPYFFFDVEQEYDGSLARASHHPPTADADTLAVARRAPSCRLDPSPGSGQAKVSATPSPSLSPRAAPRRRLGALATDGGEKCGLGGRSTLAVYDEWNQWLWHEVGIRGFRMDAVKHFPAAFTGALLNALHAAGIVPPLVVGEHFTGDAMAVKSWIDAVYAAMTEDAASAIAVRAFDFELRAALKQAVEDGLFDVRNVFQSGLVDRAGLGGLNVVTFINNHDFRTPEEHLLERQDLAYAYLLTNNRIGLPSVFHPDYYGVDIYGSGHPLREMRPTIDVLIAIHRLYITGAPTVEYLNRFATPYSSAYQSSGPYDHLLYQIQGGVGGRDVIVVINFENQPLRFNHAISTANAPPGTVFTLIAGRSDYPQPAVEISPGGIVDSLYFDVPAYAFAVYTQGEPLPGTPALDRVHGDGFETP